MSPCLSKVKVRRSVRILDKQISRKSSTFNPSKSFKSPSQKSSKTNLQTNSTLKPSFSDIVHQVSQSKKEYFTQLMLSLRFINKLKPPNNEEIAQKAVFLEKKSIFSHSKTIIFDLDETLVHCCENPKDAEKTIKIELPTGGQIEVGINIRPYAIECLTSLSKKFEIIVFTASHRCYADVVLDLLDPNHEIIHHRLYRENCVVVDGVLIKDLRVITNRKIEDIAIVDNSAYCFAYQIDNGIPIVSWENDRNDNELLELNEYLMSVQHVKDVRISNRNTFHLKELSNNTHILLEQL